MALEIKRLADEPILVFTYDGAIGLEDLHTIEAESIRLSEGLETVYRIQDARKLKLSFSEMMIFMNDSAGQERRPGSLADPRFINIVVVALGSLAEFGAKSLGQEQFGSINIPVFESLDEAFGYARSQSSS